MKEYPIKKSAKQMNIPIKETILASEDGFNGVLIQETLPPFSIHTKELIKINVPQIPVEELEVAFEKTRLCDKGVQADALWNVFRKYISIATVEPGYIGFDAKQFEFAKKSLRLFYCEYRQLNQNNLHMSALIRAAIRDRVTFDFYEPGGPSGSISAAMEGKYARYSYTRKALEFNINTYYKSSSKHNTLAHELCHFVMDDKGTGAYKGTLTNSDFGDLWYKTLEAEAFFGRKEIKSRYYENLNKKTRFRVELAKHYGFIIFGKSYKEKPDVQRGEMFARVMGLLAAGYKKMGCFSTESPLRCGVQLVCELAKAKADNNIPLYNAILKVLQNYKANDELQKKMDDIRDWQHKIIRGKYSFAAFDRLDELYNDLHTSMKKEYRKIQNRIQRAQERRIDIYGIKAGKKAIRQAGRLHKVLAWLSYKNAKEYDRKLKIEKIKKQKEQMQSPIKICSQKPIVVQELPDTSRQR